MDCVVKRGKHRTIENPSIDVRIDGELLAVADIDDLYFRLAWAGAGANLYITGKGRERFEKFPEPTLPESFDPAIGEMARFVSLEGPPGGPNARVQIVARKSSGALASSLSVRRRFVGNPAESVEGQELCSLVHSSFYRDLDAIRHQSYIDFLGLLSGPWAGKDLSYVIATGPSFDAYKEFDDFDSAFVVTCNSAVVNKGFMESVRPDLVVFGDPIFHFGPSKYAGDFRRRLLESAAENEFWIAVPEKYYFLYRYFLPELLNRTLFVPIAAPGTGWNGDLRFRFEVQSTQNILTLLMLPFASTVSRRIRVMGCDGRELGEDSYFWGHSASAQISDKMQNIKEVHPGFFSIDYNDYYLRHCRLLESQIRSIEKRGRIVESVAPSKMPALADRAVESGLRSQMDCRINDALLSAFQRKLRFSAKRLSLEERNVEFVSVNPSLRSRMGHSLYQDKSIRSVIKERGGEFVSLGAATLEPDLADTFILPVFRTTVWEIHRSRGAARSGHVENFLEDMFEGLAELARKVSLENATVFLYLGHPAIVPGFLQRWRNRPFACKQFVFNLFSGFFDRPGEAGEEGDFQILKGLKRLVDLEFDVRLTCDSKPFAQRMWDVTGASMSVLPMCPSQKLVAGGNERKSDRDRVRIVFPSHAEEIRGYKLLVRFLYRYSKRFEDKFEFEIRSYAPWTRSLPKRFNRENISWVTGLLSEDEYGSLLGNADVILLPYSPTAFGYRTSSIMTEAFGLGIPVITSAGSWLGQQVQLLDSGWLMGSWDVQGLRECLDRVWEEREKLGNDGRSGRVHKWLEENSVERFIEEIEAEQGKDQEEGLQEFSEFAAQRLLLDAVGVQSSDSKSGMSFAAKIRKRLVETAPEFILEPSRVVIGGMLTLKNNLFLMVKRGLRLATTRRGGVEAIRLERLSQGYSPDEGKSLNESALIEACLQLGRGKEFIRVQFIGKPAKRCEGVTSNFGWVECSAEDGDSNAIDCLMAGGEFQIQEVKNLLGHKDKPKCIWIEFENDREDHFEDLGRLLEGAGYQVWISEWHESLNPQEQDSWFRLVVFPSYPVRKGGKGSIIAFRRFVSDQEMSVAASKALRNRIGSM